MHLGYLMYDTERWGVIYGQGKYIIQTISGKEELYDLSADPGETENLADKRSDELPKWRELLTEAAGWPVGPGWRLEFSGRKGVPLVLEFPVPIADAGVFNPEAARKRRANLEWGESPTVTAQEVASVVISDDRTRVTVKPGKKPRGTLYVLFGSQAPEGCILISGDERVEASDWHNIVVWEQQAERVCRYLGKGAPVVVEGRLQQRAYQDREGHRRFATDVVAERVTFLPRGQSIGPASRSAEASGGAGQSQQAKARAGVMVPPEAGSEDPPLEELCF